MSHHAAMLRTSSFVIPAKAGIQGLWRAMKVAGSRLWPTAVRNNFGGLRFQSFDGFSHRHSCEGTLLSGINSLAGSGSVVAQRWGSDRPQRRLELSACFAVIPAKAGGAFQQTNVWSSSASTLQKPPDSRLRGNDDRKIAGLMAVEHRRHIYSGQQCAKAGIALEWRRRGLGWIVRPEALANTMRRHTVEVRFLPSQE